MPYKICRDDELYHHGVEGQKWGVRRYQNEDGSYKPGAEGRYDPDGSSNGKTGRNIKNRVKAKLGIYGPKDDNPYVSDKRKINRAAESVPQKRFDKKNSEKEADKARKKAEKAKKKQLEAEEKARKNAAEEKEAEEWLEDMRTRYENTQREKAEAKAAKEARRKADREKRAAYAEQKHQERQAKRDERASKNSYKKIAGKYILKNLGYTLAGNAVGTVIAKKTGNPIMGAYANAGIQSVGKSANLIRSGKQAYELHDYRKRKKAQHSDISGYDALYHSEDGMTYGIVYA